MNAKEMKIKKLSPEEYLNMIRPYLRDIINDHKAQEVQKVTGYKTILGEWEIQLTMSINFISHKDSNETRTMHTECDNIEIMMSSETDEIIEELFKSLLQRYQGGLEESKKRSEFVCDSVDLLYYELQKTSLKRTG